jgi:hypothetical protein
MRKSFSLIEILIVVAIASIVGLTNIQMHSNSLRILELVDSRIEANKFSSFIFSNIDIELHNKKKSVKEFIEDRYTITDDELLHYLKEREFEYLQDELYFMNFGSGEESSEEEMMGFEKVEESSEVEATEELQKNGILIELVTIKDERNSSVSLYHFTFME